MFRFVLFFVSFRFILRFDSFRFAPFRRVAVPCCPLHLQAGHDQAARLNRVCGAAFALPKQFADDLADDAATNRDTGLSEPRLIAPEELDFGGKVRMEMYLLAYCTQ